MSELTSLAYPLEKLTIVSAQLAPNRDATHSLGDILVKEVSDFDLRSGIRWKNDLSILNKITFYFIKSWIEYPKFVFTHHLLVAQIIQQWTANIVTFCDKCFQVQLLIS